MSRRKKSSPPPTRTTSEQQRERWQCHFDALDPDLKDFIKTVLVPLAVLHNPRRQMASAVSDAVGRIDKDAQLVGIRGNRTFKRIFDIFRREKRA